MKKLLKISIYLLTIASINCSEKEKKEHEEHGYDYHGGAARIEPHQQQQQAHAPDEYDYDDDHKDVPEDPKFEFIPDPNRKELMKYYDLSYDLNKAVKENDPGKVKDFLAKGADPNGGIDYYPDPADDITSSYQNLLVASKNGNLQIVKMLVDAGADPKLKDHLGKTAETIATENNHQEIAKLLKEYKTSPVKINKWKLQLSKLRPETIHSIPTGEIEVYEYAGEHEEIEIHDRIPNDAQKIFRAIDMHSIGLLEKAIHEKQDINAQTEKKKITPLMYAAKMNRPAIVKRLLKAGANISLKDSDGKKFIDYAKEHKEVMEIVQQYKNYIASLQRTLKKKTAGDTAGLITQYAGVNLKDLE